MSQPITRHHPIIDGAPRVSLPPAASDRAIADFLAGRSNGEALLHTLFDPVLDEPLPPELSGVLEPSD